MDRLSYCPSVRRAGLALRQLAFFPNKAVDKGGNVAYVENQYGDPAT
jgi:hypothetical protein